MAKLALVRFCLGLMLGFVAVPSVALAQPELQIQGRVFLDANGNGQLDAEETGIENVSVSNGTDVVLTDSEGHYQLPAFDDLNLFVIKPTGYQSPLSDDGTPQFYYIHKIKGSPKLEYGGLPPSGPLPERVDFPLTDVDETEPFRCLVFGDPQPYTRAEFGFVRSSISQVVASAKKQPPACVIVAGDVVGDDLTLLAPTKQTFAQLGAPHYFAPGNHDVDFDADTDADSLDTFRREWGPPYYAFNIGKVHFVVLDNVRYPCNGVDPHDFCATDKPKTYNGVVSQQQLEWLKGNLALVPKDRLIVLTTHIPLLSFSDSRTTKHSTDNLAELAKLLEGRKVLSLAGHTHTTENIEPGLSYPGWPMAAPFHQIIVGAVSGSWWTGDLGANGLPAATQRLGGPRGYYSLAFDGPDYIDTFVAFGRAPSEQMHTSFNTPRFRKWATSIFAYRDAYPEGFEVLPPVTVNALGDIDLVTQSDLKGGTWLAINVWNGSDKTQVEMRINDGDAIIAAPVQQRSLAKDNSTPASWSGPEFTDPHALMKQATVGRVSFRSIHGGDETAGHRVWEEVHWHGEAGPLPRWMLTKTSPHLWRADLPADLKPGVHRISVKVTDRYGRRFEHLRLFEVMDAP